MVVKLAFALFMAEPEKIKISPQLKLGMDYPLSG
jgi:hypothetical protein